MLTSRANVDRESWIFAKAPDDRASYRFWPGSDHHQDLVWCHSAIGSPTRSEWTCRDRRDRTDLTPTASHLAMQMRDRNCGSSRANGRSTMIVLFPRRASTAFDHQLLGFTVQRRSRLVEDQHAGIVIKRTRNSNALALSTGEAHPSLTHDRLEPRREQCHEGIELRSSDRALHGRRVNVSLPNAERNVAAYRIIGEINVLRHIADGALPRLRSPNSSRRPSIRTFPADGSSSPNRRSTNVGLACARRSDNRHRSSALNAKRTCP